MGRAGIIEDTIDEGNVEKAGAVNFCLFSVCFVVHIAGWTWVKGVMIPDWRCFKPQLLPSWTCKLPTLLRACRYLSWRGRMCWSTEEKEHEEDEGMKTTSYTLFLSFLLKPLSTTLLILRMMMKKRSLLLSCERCDGKSIKIFKKIYQPAISFTNIKSSFRNSFQPFRIRSSRPGRRKLRTKADAYWGDFGINSEASSERRL